MPVKMFCCYAHEDEALLKKLKTHLRPLQRQGLVDVWYDRDISAGTDWEQQIKERLNTAQIILLLVSPDFMASDYCYSIEMQRAIERHERGEAHVIPIILRPVYWQDVLGKLQALPTDAIPVMSSGWHYQDEAFLNVTEGIRKVVVELTTRATGSSSGTDIQLPKSGSPLDIVAVAEQARKLEEQFQANGYKGRSDSQNILELKGTLPVLLSAPHGVMYPREGELKEAQWNTGALTLQLAQLTNASALVAARTSDEDPNWGEPGLYKRRLKALIEATRPCFVLDIHGLSDRARKDIIIGTANGKALLGRTQLVDVLQETLIKGGITQISLDKIYTADRPDTITRYASSKELKTPAVQLEIAWSIRDFSHAPQKYSKLLNVLSDAIFAMYWICRK